MNRMGLFVLAVAAGALDFAVQLQAASIGLEFNDGIKPALLASDSAGVGAAAQTNWNVTTSYNWSSLALHDDSGATTAVTLTGSAAGNYFSGAVNDTAGDVKLTSSEVYNGWSGFGNAGNSKITFSGIPYASYDVYVYASTDTYDRIETFAVTPSGGTTSFQSFTLLGGGSSWILSNNPVEGWNGSDSKPTLPAGANYARFTGVSSSSFTLEWTE